jgi:hypothetical protein
MPGAAVRDRSRSPRGGHHVSGHVTTPGAHPLPPVAQPQAPWLSSASPLYGSSYDPIARLRHRSRADPYAGAAPLRAAPTPNSSLPSPPLAASPWFPTEGGAPSAFTMEHGYSRPAHEGEVATPFLHAGGEARVLHWQDPEAMPMAMQPGFGYKPRWAAEEESDYAAKNKDLEKREAAIGALQRAAYEAGKVAADSGASSRQLLRAPPSPGTPPTPPSSASPSSVFSQSDDSRPSSPLLLRAPPLRDTPPTSPSAASSSSVFSRPDVDSPGQAPAPASPAPEALGQASTKGKGKGPPAPSLPGHGAPKGGAKIGPTYRRQTPPGGGAQTTGLLAPQPTQGVNINTATLDPPVNAVLVGVLGMLQAMFGRKKRVPVLDPNNGQHVKVAGPDGRPRLAYAEKPHPAWLSELIAQRRKEQGGRTNFMSPVEDGKIEFWIGPDYRKDRTSAQTDNNPLVLAYNKGPVRHDCAKYSSLAPKILGYTEESVWYEPLRLAFLDACCVNDAVLFHAYGPRKLAKAHAKFVRSGRHTRTLDLQNFVDSANEPDSTGSSADDDISAVERGVRPKDKAGRSCDDADHEKTMRRLENYFAVVPAAWRAVAAHIDAAARLSHFKKLPPQGLALPKKRGGTNWKILYKAAEYQTKLEGRDLQSEHLAIPNTQRPVRDAGCSEYCWDDIMQFKGPLDSFESAYKKALKRGHCRHPDKKVLVGDTLEGGNPSRFSELRACYDAIKRAEGGPGSSSRSAAGVTVARQSGAPDTFRDSDL